MTATLVGVIGIIALIVLILLGIPIAFSLMVVGVTGFACLTSPTAALSLLAKDTFLTISSYFLCRAAPVFPHGADRFSDRLESPVV